MSGNGPREVRLHARAVRRRVLVASLMLPLLASSIAPAWTAPAWAQDQANPAHRKSRTKIFTVLGALAGGAIGLAVAKGAGSQHRHGCLGVPCVFVGSVVIGAGAGFAIGHEADRTYYSRYRGVAPLRLRGVSAELDGIPTSLSADDDAIAVGGNDGVQVFDAHAGLVGPTWRARGLNGISSVELAPPSSWLAVGSPIGLYLFPPRQGPGALVRPGDVSAIAGAAQHVYVAVERRIEVAPLATDSTATWPGVTLTSPAHALEYDAGRSILWATTDRELIAFRPVGDSLERIGSAPLDGAGRRIAIGHDTLAVAMGERGVRVFDVTAPAAPRAIGSWSIAHFAYDVAIDGRRLFVAAGPEGVYVLELGSPALRTLGLARGLGFASALASRGGYTYILDRRANALRRILSAF